MARAAPPPKRCLVFGGNGFIGAEAVKSLLESELEFDITVANRGKSWEWDTPQTVKPFVKCLNCDRKKPLLTYPDLVSYVKSAGGVIDLVLDFSGYGPFAVDEAVNLLDELDTTVGLYVYISSDSVYEVCEKTHSGPTRETDAVRPESKVRRRSLKHADNYGHKKLKCEEVFPKYRQIPVIILRLADVVGKRDSTDRWWQYQLWMKLSAEFNVPIFVPKELEKRPMSFVYASDVAQLIRTLAETDNLKLKPLHGEAFNLAFSDKITIEQLLEDMRSVLRTQPVGIEYLSEGAPHIFPSVDNGPIDISKAEALLPWKPTPWKSAVKDIVEFYKEAANTDIYKHNLHECLGSLLKDLQETPVDGGVVKAMTTAMNIIGVHDDDD